MRIGRRIKEIMTQKQRGATWLAKNLPCERSNVYYIYERQSIDELNGFATLTELTSGGNGLSCQVSFSLTFGGDIKSVTLVREKYLTYPYPYDGYGYGYGVKPERRVIDLTNKTSPYKFSYTLHLGDGDNYLPVIVTDMRGNQIEYQINIPASFTRTPDTEININNNLNVN